MEELAQKEDQEDHEDGLLTTALFVTLGLCILMALVLSRG